MLCLGHRTRACLWGPGWRVALSSPSPSLPLPPSPPVLAHNSHCVLPPDLRTPGFTRWWVNESIRALVISEFHNVQKTTISKMSHVYLFIPSALSHWGSHSVLI